MNEAIQWADIEDALHQGKTMLRVCDTMKATQ
jgi:hypothetical protein